MKDSSAYNKDFGERVHKYRLKRGYTLEELARRAGYTSANSRSTMLKIENGRNAVPLSKVADIAKALSVSPMYLLGFEPEDETEDDIDVIVHRLENLPITYRDDAVTDMFKILDYYEAIAKK